MTAAKLPADLAAKKRRLSNISMSSGMFPPLGGDKKSKQTSRVNTGRKGKALPQIGSTTPDPKGKKDSAKGTGPNNVLEFVYSKAVEKALRKYGFLSPLHKTVITDDRYAEADVMRLALIHDDIRLMRHLQEVAKENIAKYVDFGEEDESKRRGHKYRFEQIGKNRNKKLPPLNATEGSDGSAWDDGIGITPRNMTSRQGTHPNVQTRKDSSGYLPPLVDRGSTMGDMDLRNSEGLGGLPVEDLRMSIWRHQLSVSISYLLSFRP